MKYIPYIIGALMALGIVMLLYTNKDLKSLRNDLTNEIQENKAMLEVSRLQTRKLTLKNIGLLDSVSVIGGLLTNSYANRQREAAYYEQKLRQIPKLTPIQIDSAINERYPNTETRDVEILTDVIEGEKCAIELRFADNQIDLLKRRNIKQNKVIQNQAEIIRNKDYENGLLQAQADKLNELVDIQDKQIRRAKWKTRGIIIIGGAILILTNI